MVDDKCWSGNDLSQFVRGEIVVDMGEYGSRDISPLGAILTRLTTVLKDVLLVLVFSQDIGRLVDDRAYMFDCRQLWESCP